LQQREKPADIVISLFGFAEGSPDEPISDIYDDKDFQFVQKFYNDVSQQTRELVIYSTMNICFGESPRKTVLRQVSGPVNPMEFPETMLIVSGF
jgi:hypothetical protein